VIRGELKTGFCFSKVGWDSFSDAKIYKVRELFLSEGQ
jgi:hypothetical protein